MNSVVSCSDDGGARRVVCLFKDWSLRYLFYYVSKLIRKSQRSTFLRSNLLVGGLLPSCCGLLCIYWCGQILTNWHKSINHNFFACKVIFTNRWWKLRSVYDPFIDMQSLSPFLTAHTNRMCMWWMYLNIKAGWTYFLHFFRLVSFLLCFYWHLHSNAIKRIVRVCC